MRNFLIIALMIAIVFPLYSGIMKQLVRLIKQDALGYSYNLNENILTVMK